MLFNSATFAMLVAVTFAAYYAPFLRRWQAHVLIASSFIFYSFEAPVLLLLLLVSILINVVTSYKVATTTQRRFWAVLGVGLNVAILLFFKYSPLFAKTVLSTTSAEGSIGHFLVTLPLPIGISFFTFQGISLVVEVFQNKDSRGSVAPGVESGLVAADFTTHLRNTALFKSFFPVLVAGPIVRAHEFYPQIRPKALRGIDWEAAFRALVVGYFLKMVVADNLKDSTYLLEYPAFLNESSLVLMGLLFGYSMQIFADFAGYSLIAIGLGHLFGYHLPTNFNFPYVARSFSDFWRRWHISLSTWLRDFLYVPLGGNRCGRLRMYLNLFAVMFLGGLWHGAAWSYAIWGGFHGLALAAERLLRGRLSIPRNRATEALRILMVFAFVTLAWLLFKLPEFGHVIAYFRALFANQGETNSVVLGSILFYSLPVVLFHGWYLLREYPRMRPIGEYRFVVFGTLISGIVLNSGAPGRFIYFQF